MGVAVISINPSWVKIPIIAKIASTVKDLPTDNQELWTLYSRYLTDVQAKFEANSAGADDTTVTTRTIMRALTEPRPKDHYYCGQVDGIPSIVVAFTFRVLPTYLADVLIENF